MALTTTEIVLGVAVVGVAAVAYSYAQENAQLRQRLASQSGGGLLGSIIGALGGQGGVNSLVDQLRHGLDFSSSGAQAA